jgi:hypothetical protein
MCVCVCACGGGRRTEQFSLTQPIRPQRVAAARLEPRLRERITRLPAAASVSGCPHDRSANIGGSRGSRLGLNFCLPVRGEGGGHHSPSKAAGKKCRCTRHRLLRPCSTRSPRGGGGVIRCEQLLWAIPPTTTHKPEFHHTPCNGHRMAYGVWIVWGSYGAHTVKKCPCDDRMPYGVWRMPYGV